MSANAETKVPLTLKDNFTMEQVLELPVVDREDLAKSYAKTLRRFDDAKGEKNDHTIRAGVLLCALSIQLEEDKKLRRVRQEMTLKEFANNVLSKGEKDNLSFPAAAYTYKRVVGAFVKNGFVTYEQYYRCSTRCLDLAGQIVKALEDATVSLAESEAFQNAAKELAGFSKDSAKKLKAILDSIKPTETMSAEKAIDAIRAICAAGHRDLIPCELADQINGDENVAARAASFGALMTALDRVQEKLPQSAQDETTEKLDDRDRLLSTAPVLVENRPVEAREEAVAA